MKDYWIYPGAIADVRPKKLVPPHFSFISVSRRVKSKKFLVLAVFQKSFHSTFRKKPSNICFSRIFRLLALFVWAYIDQVCWFHCKGVPNHSFWKNLFFHDDLGPSAQILSKMICLILARLRKVEFLFPFGSFVVKNHFLDCDPPGDYYLE